MPTIPWDQVREVVDAVLDLPPDQRTPYLDQACPQPAVRRYVESLVLSYEQAGQFLGEPALVSHSDAIAHDEADSWKGRRVGPYQVIEEIGEGGMGSVYRAIRVDDQYQKQVAIKVVRSGFDTRFALNRFKAERQILANLEHPNIARLLEGGTTDDGQPYFVMEYIQGQPFDQYCDDHKLTITERLRLFRTVCSAVQYAHQNLVIHRDIKPNNVLVNADGIPKLLDFGIAKILTPESSSPAATRTMTMVQLLTPEYASPEQLLDEPVTTASDIYSLGVVLYELLTGNRPYRFTTRKPDDIARVVAEKEPQKPSTAVVRVEENLAAEGDSVRRTPEEISRTREGSPEKLRRRLAGDLDNIVLMALRKEPQRRYSSVEQFSEDIRRHLDGLPVVARTDTFFYRSSKFVKRHTAGVTAAALVALSLALGLAFALREAQIARQQRARAEERFNDVRELAKSNLSEFHDAIKNLPGSAAARHLIIQRTLGYLDGLSHDAAGDRGILRELASGYQQIGDLQGNFSGPGIGDSGAALQSYRKAWTIRESLTASGNDLSDRKAEINLLSSYVRTLQLTGNTQDALHMATVQLAMAEQVAQQQHNDRDSVIDEARAQIHLGAVLGGNGSSNSTRELTGAIQHDRRALELLAPLMKQAPPSAALRSFLQATLDLAYHLRKNREFEASLKIYDSLWSNTNGLQSLPVAAQALFFNHRSRLFDDIEDYARADKDNHKSWELTESLLQADPQDLLVKINNAGNLGTVGLDEARLGHALAGKKKLDEAIHVGEEMLADNPYEIFYKDLLSIGYSYRAEILCSMGDFPGALEQYSRSLTGATEIAQRDPGDLESRLSTAKLHAALGIVHARASQYPEAKQEFTTALTNFQELLRTRPQDPEMIYVSRATENALAVVSNCSAGRPCKEVRELKLPKLNN